MSEEKPLHVRVAEALGCKVWKDWGFGPCCMCEGFRHGTRPEPDGDTRIPRYDTDWSATGPLIEKYGLGVARSIKLSDPPQPGENWDAHEPLTKMWASGWSNSVRRSTPLVAVCKLILALKAAGKLEAA